MYHRIFAFAAAVILDAAPAGGYGVAAQSASVEGCYRADRPLGTSAASAYGREVPGDVGRRIGEDSVGLGRLTTFRLLPGGHVGRPGTAMSKWWALGSKWVAVGDTLRVTLSTRTSGWALWLVQAPAGGDSVYVGAARYLTDVVVKDTAWHASEVAIRVRREHCPPGT
jgi:hypothetical protein